MRLLLDECLPRKLKSYLPGHEVRTVPEMGWAGASDIRIQQLAAGSFDGFVTVDRGIRAAIPDAAELTVAVLSVPSNRLQDILPVVPKLLAALEGSEPPRVS